MGVWATKAGMTSIFTPEGLCLPATVLALEEGNIVTQVSHIKRSGCLICIACLRRFHQDICWPEPCSLRTIWKEALECRSLVA